MECIGEPTAPVWTPRSEQQSVHGTIFFILLLVGYLRRKQWGRGGGKRGGGAAGRLDPSHAGAGRLSVSFLYGAPESRWLVNGSIPRAVYRLLHITGVSLGNFSNTKLCQGQKSFTNTKRRPESIKVSADSRCQTSLFYKRNVFVPPPLTAQSM